MGPIYGTQLGCIPLGRLWLGSMCVCVAQCVARRLTQRTVSILCVSNRSRQIQPAREASKDGVGGACSLAHLKPVCEIPSLLRDTANLAFCCRSVCWLYPNLDLVKASPTRKWRKQISSLLKAFACSLVS